MQRSNSIMHKEAETTCRRTACTAALTWRHAEFMCSLPLGMWWMLLSWAPRGAMHVFLVHKASAGIKHKAGKNKNKKRSKSISYSVECRWIPPTSVYGEFSSNTQGPSAGLSCVNSSRNCKQFQQILKKERQVTREFCDLWSCQWHQIIVIEIVHWKSTTCFLSTKYDLNIWITTIKLVSFK